MAALSTLALIGGLALSGAGTAIQYEGAKDASEASKRAEAARQQQMQLESNRRKREIVRQGILARSQATTTATAQNAQFGSGLANATSSISSQAGYNIQGVSQAESIGNRIFAANRDMADAQSEQAFGQGLGSLGGALTKNLGPIGRLTYGY